VWSAFAHSGQVCIRTERVLIEASVADEFTRLCAAEISRLRQAPPPKGDGEIDIGAITFLPQIERAERQIEDALAKGARLVAGGHRRNDLGGQFFEPTLLADVTPDMLVAHEETFGPLLPVLRVKDAEEALRQANDSPLGLSGSVWSRDRVRAQALARRLEAGSVCVNDVLLTYLCVEAPIGGVKSSGLGVRHGPECLRQFCRIETIVSDQPLLGLISPFISRRLSFPYRADALRFLRWVMRRVY
jgi:acyl-CoA reductase-like NAD-dependent aldehyde dehydrogenase